MEATNFVAYYRVSTQRQGESGLGLEAQKAQVERYVQGVGGRVLAEFTEVESGKRVTRPELDAAIQIAQQHGATLIVAKLDRLARNARYLLKLRDSKLQVTFCDLPDVPSGAVGKFMIGQMALVAEFERDRISERTKSAIAAKKARGQPWGTGGRVMARRNRRRADEFAIQVREKVAHVGKLEDMTIIDAMQTLNAQEIATPRGYPWKQTTTQRLLYRLRRVVREETR